MGRWHKAWHALHLKHLRRLLMICYFFDAANLSDNLVSRLQNGLRVSCALASNHTDCCGVLVLLLDGLMADHWWWCVWFRLVDANAVGVHIFSATRSNLVYDVRRLYRSYKCSSALLVVQDLSTICLTRLYYCGLGSVFYLQLRLSLITIIKGYFTFWGVWADLLQSRSGWKIDLGCSIAVIFSIVFLLFEDTERISISITVCGRWVA